MCHPVWGRKNSLANSQTKLQLWVLTLISKFPARTRAALTLPLNLSCNVFLQYRSSHINDTFMLCLLQNWTCTVKFNADCIRTQYLTGVETTEFTFFCCWIELQHFSSDRNVTHGDGRNDGGSKRLWNVCQYLPDQTAQHPRRRPSLNIHTRRRENLKSHLPTRLFHLYVGQPPVRLMDKTESASNLKPSFSLS
jgi:hypothetical protein